MISAVKRLRQKKLIKAGLWYVIGNLSQRAIAFLSLPIIARLLLPEQIGVVSVWQGWVSILSIVLTLNVSTSVTNAATEFPDENYRNFLGAIVITAIASSIVGTVLLQLLPASVSTSIFGVSKPLLLLACVVGGMTGIVQIQMMVYRQKYAYSSYNLLAIGTQIVAVIFGVLLIVLPPRIWPDYDVTYGQPFGILISLAIPTLIILRASVAGSRGRFHPDSARYALAIGIPLILHTLAHSLLSRSDTYLIAQLVGERETGIYSIAYRFGEIVLAVWAGSTNVWTVWFFERMKAEDRTIIRVRAKQYVLGFALVTLLLMVAAPIALRLLTPEPYWAGIRLVPVIMSAGYFAMLYGLYIPVEYFYKRTRITGVVTLFAAVINIGLNLMLIPAIGYEAAAFTTVAAYALMFAGHAYYVESRFDVRGLFDLRLLALAGVGMAIAGIGLGSLMSAILNH
jgi:O-antigen/teichoic acid export membrane protein